MLKSGDNRHQRAIFSKFRECCSLTRLFENTRLHQLLQWQDRLIAEGDKALADLLDQQPNLDRQHLRQLMRNAQQEAKKNKPPKSARELFRYLREAME